MGCVCEGLVASGRRFGTTPALTLAPGDRQTLRPTILLR
jgi:hypothetical protein